MSIITILGFMKGEQLKNNINELIDRKLIKLDESKVTKTKLEYITTQEPYMRIHVIVDPCSIYKIEEEL